jgi:hypothetical protein
LYFDCDDERLVLELFWSADRAGAVKPLVGKLALRCAHQGEAEGWIGMRGGSEGWSWFAGRERVDAPIIERLIGQESTFVAVAAKVVRELYGESVPEELSAACLLHLEVEPRTRDGSVAVTKAHFRAGFASESGYLSHQAVVVLGPNRSVDFLEPLEQPAAGALAPHLSAITALLRAEE